MSDPLADPRAADLLAADPDDVAALSAQFRAAAERAGMTEAGLRAAEQDATWRGRAADRFHRSIGPLPGELAHVRAGYAEVAGALAAYHPELARIRSAFLRLIAELDGVRAPEEAAHLSGRARALLEEFAAVRDACRGAIAAAQGTAVIRR